MDALPFDLSQLIEDYPTWELMNAYERTKIVCGAYTRTGQTIPTWTTIRTIIGKGSPQDINRAKDDYRMQLAEELKALSKMPTNVPEALGQLMLTVWAKAVSEAQTQFNHDREQLNTHIEQLDHHIAFLNDSLSQSKQLVDVEQQKRIELQATIDALQLSNEQLQQQVAADAQARSEIQALYDDALAKSNHAQASMNDAITRLEGVENHMLMRIEEAKADYATKLSQAANRHQRETQDWHLTEAKLRKAASDAMQRERDTQLEVQRLTNALEVAQATIAQMEKMIAGMKQSASASLARKRGLRSR